MSISPERLPERLPDMPDVRPPTYLWLTVSLSIASLLAVAGMLGQVYGGAEIIPLLDTPLRVIFVILAILLVLNTIRFIPRANTPAYRRLPLLLLLAVPWLVALAGGPLGFVEVSHAAGKAGARRAVRAFVRLVPHTSPDPAGLQEVAERPD